MIKRYICLLLTLCGCAVLGDATKGAPDIGPGPSLDTKSSFNGKELLIGASLWDVETGAQLRLFPVGSLGDGYIAACTFSPNSRRIAIASYYSGAADYSSEKELLLYETQTGLELNRIGPDTFDPVTAVEFSPDGGHILTHDASHIRMWDVGTGQPSLSLNALSSTTLVGCQLFSPDGRRIVTHSSNRVLAILDVATGAQICAITNETGTPRPTDFTLCRFSPDGQFILADVVEGIGKVFDSTTGRPIQEFSGAKRHNPAYPLCALFTPDSQEVISGADDGIAVLWESKTGKEIRSFKTPGSGWGPVYKMTISSSGKRLITVCGAGSSADEGVALWDVESGRLIKQLDAQEAIVGFSPADERFITTKDGKPATLWNGETGTIIRKLQ